MPSDQTPLKLELCPAKTSINDKWLFYALDGGALGNSLLDSATVRMGTANSVSVCYRNTGYVIASRWLSYHVTLATPSATFDDSISWELFLKCSWPPVSWRRLRLSSWPAAVAACRLTSVPWYHSAPWPSQPKNPAVVFGFALLDVTSIGFQYPALVQLRLFDAQCDTSVDGVCMPSTRVGHSSTRIQTRHCVQIWCKLASLTGSRNCVLHALPIMLSPDLESRRRKLVFVIFRASFTHFECMRAPAAVIRHVMSDLTTINIKTVSSVTAAEWMSTNVCRWGRLSQEFRRLAASTTRDLRRLPTGGKSCPRKLWTVVKSATQSCRAVEWPPRQRPLESWWCDVLLSQ